MTVHDVAAALPDIATLRYRCRVLAVLNAILEPDVEDRDHQYDQHWRPGQELASNRTGGGDEYSIVFCAGGAFIRGLDHESPMNLYDEGKLWPGLVDSVPDTFRRYVTEPEFSVDGDGLLAATVCLWRQTSDDGWRTGDIAFPTNPPKTMLGSPDGAGYLFTHLADWSPERFQDWARDFFEIPVDVEGVRRVYAGQPLTEQLVSSINPRRSLADLADDLARIGYPSSAPG